MMAVKRCSALVMAAVVTGLIVRSHLATAEALATEHIGSEMQTVAQNNSNAMGDIDRVKRPSLPESIVSWDATPALRVVRGAWENARTSEYTSVTRVNEEVGHYAFDCSGFVQWVLKRSHPVAARWAAAGLPHRPLARDYYTRIAAIKPDRPRFGWSRVARVADIAPGDVMAWIKPKEVNSKNTGHVVFAVLPPVQLANDANTYLVRVADATRLWHADDTRQWRGAAPERTLPPGQDTSDESPNDQGLGFGTISIVADPQTGAPLEYGWVATHWRTFATQIAIGRPTR